MEIPKKNRPMTAKTEKTFPQRNDYLLAGILSVILIGLLDLLTNHVDVTRFQWDFRY